MKVKFHFRPPPGLSPDERVMANVIHNRKKMKFIPAIFDLMIIAILPFLINVYSYAEDPDLAKLFHTRGVEGTFIIDSLDGKRNLYLQ